MKYRGNMQQRVLAGIKLGMLQFYGKHLKQWATRNALMEESWMKNQRVHQSTFKWCVDTQTQNLCIYI